MPIKISTGIFKGLGKLFQKHLWQSNYPRKPGHFWKRISWDEPTQTDTMTYCESWSNKEDNVHWNEDRQMDQWDRTEPRTISLWPNGPFR